MIYQGFVDFFGLVSIRLPECRFGFGVPPLSTAARKTSSGSEPVEWQCSMSAESASHLLHRHKLTSDRTRAPTVEELTSPAHLYCNNHPFCFPPRIGRASAHAGHSVVLSDSVVGCSLVRPRATHLAEAHCATRMIRESTTTRFRRRRMC